MADVSAKVAFSVSYCKTQSSTSSYNIILSGRLNIKEKRRKVQNWIYVMLEGEKAQEYRVILVLRKIKKHVFKPFFFRTSSLNFSIFPRLQQHIWITCKKIKLRRQYTQKISKANPLKPTKWFLDVKLTHFHITINPWRPEDVK